MCSSDLTDNRYDLALLLGGTESQRKLVRFKYCLSAAKRFVLANVIWAAATITPPYDLLDEFTRAFSPYYIWTMDCAAAIAFALAFYKLGQIEKLNNAWLVRSTLDS